MHSSGQMLSEKCITVVYFCVNYLVTSYDGSIQNPLILKLQDVHVLQVSYAHIKSYLTMLDLHVSTEEILGRHQSSKTGEVNIKTSELSPSPNHRTQHELSQESKTFMDSVDLHSLDATGEPSPVHSFGPGAVSGKKQRRSDEPATGEIPINKCHKVDIAEQGNILLKATEGTILEWLRTQDGVSCTPQYAVENCWELCFIFCW